MKNFVIALLSLFAFCFVAHTGAEAKGPEKQEVSKTFSKAGSIDFFAEATPATSFLFRRTPGLLTGPEDIYKKHQKAFIVSRHFRHPRDGLLCNFKS